MDAFESALEADIARLAQEVKSSRELPEMRNASEQEIVKNAFRAFPHFDAPQASVPQPAVPQPAPSLSGILPDYANDATPEVKLEIEYLVDLAFKSGIAKALSKASQSSPFVEDAVRDALAGKLYPELQKRGIVK